MDEYGRIAFVERNLDSDNEERAVEEQVKRKNGWEGCEIVRVSDVGFFFPGFIGRRFPSFGVGEYVINTPQMLDIVSSSFHKIWTKEYLRVACWGAQMYIRA